MLLPLALADSDGETEGEVDGSEEEHPLAHGVTLGGIGGLGGHTHVGGGGASFVAGDGDHVHFNTPFGHSIIALSGGGGGGVD